MDDAAHIVVGPLLRYVGSDVATVWVETDRACSVRVRVDGAESSIEPTWGVHGHHYALVVIEGLTPGTTTAYTVELDGQQAWPEPASTLPPSVIRTPDGRHTLRLAFGSCRRAGPFDADGLKRLGADALAALSYQIGTSSSTNDALRPDALLLCGDQMYADEPSRQMLERLRAVHDERPDRDDEIRDEVQTFEEYTWLYHESWTVPEVRWLLSTVPTAMILDDHDLRDDWNSSWSWRQDMTRKPWWRDRVVGALVSYWVYQHLGNASPRELADDQLFRKVREAADNGARERLLDDFAWSADTEPGTVRWSFSRDFANVRLLVIDSRCTRQLEPDRRAIVDAREWQWLVKRADIDVDHLLVATTLPFLMLPGIHHLEGWSEAMAHGAWGRLYGEVAERARRAVDLEHWAAFRRSFDAMVAFLDATASRVDAPASVLVLSGDVHCSYLARAHTPAVDRSRTRVHQLVMSPFRNPLASGIRVVNRLFATRPAGAMCRFLARRAGVRDPDITWTVDHGPWFDNGLMTLVLLDRLAYVEVDEAVHRDGRQLLRRRYRGRLA